MSGLRESLALCVLVSSLLLHVLNFVAIEAMREERESRETYHDTQGSDSLPVGLDMTDETHVVIHVVLSQRGREGILLTLISGPLLHHAETEQS